MKTNFNLLFYLKKQKAYVSGTMPVYMRITVNGNVQKCLPGGIVSRQGGTTTPGGALALNRK